MTTPTDSEITCCPRFDPDRWDDKTLFWENKRFVKDRVLTFINMPVNFGRVMRKLDAKITKAGAMIDEGLCLSDHTSKWNMDIYLAVDKMVPGLVNTALSGTYYCKVYEGPFTDTGKWCTDFSQVTQAKGYTIKRWLMWYTTCPKCAKKYGKNYVAILAEIQS